MYVLHILFNMHALCVYRYVCISPLDYKKIMSLFSVIQAQHLAHTSWHMCMCLC